MEFCNSNIKKLPIFSQKKAVLVFQETKPPKKLLIFSQEKAFLIFQETETPKKNPLYFRKRNFFYISGKLYSEPWHI